MIHYLLVQISGPGKNPWFTLIFFPQVVYDMESYIVPCDPQLFDLFDSLPFRASKSDSDRNSSLGHYSLGRVSLNRARCGRLSCEWLRPRDCATPWPGTDMQYYDLNDSDDPRRRHDSDDLDDAKGVALALPLRHPQAGGHRW